MWNICQTILAAVLAKRVTHLDGGRIGTARPCEPPADLGCRCQLLGINRDVNLGLSWVKAGVKEVNSLNAIDHRLIQSTSRPHNCKNDTAPQWLSYRPPGANQCRQKHPPGAASSSAAGGN